MRENIRFAVMKDGVDPYTQLAGATRELYGLRMEAFVDMYEAREAEIVAKGNLDRARAQLTTDNEEYNKLKNVQQRDTYVQTKLINTTAQHNHCLQEVDKTRTAYEMSRMSLSELRLQIDLLKMFMGDVHEEEADTGGKNNRGEEEVS